MTFHAHVVPLSSEGSSTGHFPGAPITAPGSMGIKFRQLFTAYVAFSPSSSMEVFFSSSNLSSSASSALSCACAMACSRCPCRNPQSRVGLNGSGFEGWVAVNAP